MERPFGLPTMIAYPPPPYSPPPTFVAAPLLAMARAPSPPLTRSRTYRRHRDCQFIPNMDVAVQFIEARQIAIALGKPARRVPRTASPRLYDPLAIGLLMTVMPPVGVPLLWASHRFTREAKIALTLYATFMTAVLATLAIVAMRH